MTPGVDQGQTNSRQPNGGAQSAAPAPAATITVVCTCGKKLKAPATAVGKKAKCPGCGNVMTLTAPAAAPVATPAAARATTAAPSAAPAKPKRAPAALGPATGAPPPIPAVPPVQPVPEDHGVDPNELDGLYALAASEKAAAAEAQANDAIRCPGCQSPMDAGAVLCTNCGYDTRSNKQLSTAKDQPQKKSKPALFGSLASVGSKSKGPKDKMAPQGSFLVGLGCCAAAGLIGGIVWYAVGSYIGFTIILRLLSIGIGALCGVAMQIGQRGYSKLGGVTAASITLLAIVGANVALFQSIGAEGSSVRNAGGGKSGVARFDDRVVEMLTNEQLNAAGVKDPDDATETQQDRAQHAAIKQLKNSSRAEYDALLAKAVDQQEKSELSQYVMEDVLKEKGVSLETQEADKYLKPATEEAHRRVEAMTPQDRAAALKAHHDKEAAAAKEAGIDTKNLHSKHAAGDTPGDEGDGPGSGAAVGVGLLIVFILLVFGIRSILFLIVAMGLAYKTAAGAVSG